jgi:hypothetical protein
LNIRVVELHPILIKIRALFALCRDPLNFNKNASVVTVLKKYCGSILNAKPGSVLNANQHIYGSISE